MKENKRKLKFKFKSSKHSEKFFSRDLCMHDIFLCVTFLFFRLSEWARNHFSAVVVYMNFFSKNMLVEYFFKITSSKVKRSIPKKNICVYRYSNGRNLILPYATRYVKDQKTIYLCQVSRFFVTKCSVHVRINIYCAGHNVTWLASYWCSISIQWEVSQIIHGGQNLKDNARIRACCF